MPVLKNVLGLDLGSHSIKAVEFRQTLRGFEAVQLRMLPRADDIPLPELLRRFVDLHGFSVGHVVVALPGDRTSSRHLSFPFRERRKLAQAIPFELGAELPFELDDFVMDWEVAREERNRAEVVATIVQRTEVSAAVETLREAGCEPRTVEAEGLVLGNLAAVFDLAGTRLLADVGHRKTTFCLIADGRPVWSRTALVAGAAITQGMARDRGLAGAEAERAKCEEGVFGARATGPATSNALDRLSRELVQTIGSIDPVIEAVGAEPLREVTLCGGSAQLDRLDEYLEERCGVSTARLGLPLEGHGEGLVAGGPPILFAPAIALGLRGTTQARTRSNFRQDELAFRVDFSSVRQNFGWTAALAGVAALLAVVSFFFGVVLESRRASRLEEQIARLYAEAVPGKPVPDSALAGLREEVRSANERAEFLGVYRGNLSALDLLTEVSRHVPEDLDIVFEELSIDRQTIRMRCYAKSFQATDRLGAELAKFAPFAQARIGSIERDRKTGAVRFNVTISLAPLDPERA